MNSIPANRFTLSFKLFALGIFFLASAPFVSCILFIYPLIVGIIKSRSKLLSDKFNIFFPLISLIMIGRVLIIKINYFTDYKSHAYTTNSLDLFNWVLIFACFYGFQYYLLTKDNRVIIAKIFIAGTIPVLITCIGQYWFNWYGPFEILNGLIKWFQRPLSYDNRNVTGLFNNPNYTGAWLTMVFPLAILALKEKFRLKNRLKAIITLLISILFSTSTVLTNSRAAWLGLLIPIPFIYGKKSFLALLFFTSILLFFIFSSFLPFLPNQLVEFSQVIVPNNISNKFSEIILYFDSYPRLSIWNEAINLINEKPFWGWGPGAFPDLYFIKSGFFNNHAHNLFLELSVSYGIFVPILLYSALFNLLFNGYRTLFSDKKSSLSLDRGWLAGGFVFLFAQFYDVVYFDIRINLASWIFLSAIKCIIQNNLISEKSREL